MAVASFVFGAVFGMIALSTYPTLQPLADRFSEIIVPVGKFVASEILPKLAETLIYAGESLT